MAGRPRLMAHSTVRRVLRGLSLSSLGWACLVPFAALGCDRSPDHSGARGSTITVLYDADERLFGPYWSMPSWFLMFLPLATYDESGHIVGRLARSWEHSSDYRTWTFHLRTNARWHDGEPVTAADIKFSIELAAHPHILFDDAWHGVDSIAVRDDSTLTIFYGRPRDARDTWNVYWP
ncbi:MAG: ABC transporter substrate-binding protein, partial [Gemmatimonadota bacterium]